MVEYQFINFMLQNKSISIMQRNRIASDFFLACKDQVEYLLEHYKDYGIVPDEHTFLAEFPDWEIFTVSEPEKYLVDTMREQRLFNKIVPIIKEGAELSREDSFQAMDYIKSKLRDLVDDLEFLHVGHDLINESQLRKDDYLLRVERKGLLGVPTGIEWLDDLTNGWVEEDLVVLGGFLGEGKSWILLYFLWAAWHHAKKKVLLISREMGKVMVGFRFDTWNAHFSNKLLVAGSSSLGKIKKKTKSGTDIEVEQSSYDYIKYLDELSTSDSPSFIVFTNEDNRRCTIEDIENLIDLFHPDIVGIDQLSLLHTTQKFTSIRDRYVYLTRELYRMTARKKIPILLAAQLNRSVKDKKKRDEEETEAPDMHQFSESNSIGEDATRAITFTRRGNMIKFALRKNRYGMVGTRDFLWDIDTGFLDLIDEFSEVEKSEKKEDTKGEAKKPSKVVSASEYIF